MKWVLRPQPPKEFIKQFPEYEPIVLRLLYNRNLRDQKAIDEFFNPDYREDIHDPFLMFGMEETVARILEAIKGQENIVVFGDYDADGVCGAVILKSALEVLGARAPEVYLPDRNSEGYGLNLEAVRKITAQKTKLMITIDCGITDFEEIELANSLGLEVIVVDHHLPSQKLPAAKVILNPFQEKDSYPFKELAGAGVAFKLSQGLLKKAERKIKQGWEKWLLDLVALATVADCVPLLGENRTLVRYGLVVLAQTPRLGLRELMKIARLNPTLETGSLKTNLDSYSLGFILAPRLNAAGRLEHAGLAFELLTTQDSKKAKSLAQKIENQNRQRQKITEEIVLEIEKRLCIQDPASDDYVILEKDENWTPGVLGLAAGKIAERYHRPTFIFNQQGETLRGSARSIPSLNIVEAMAQCQEFLGEFGGHAGAAGLALPAANFELFRQKINEVARRVLKSEDLVPTLAIDLELEPADISWGFFDDLMRFEPFGEANERPKFLIKDWEVVSLRLVGNGLKHLKLELKSDKMPEKIFKAIGFGLAANGQNGDLKIGDKIDVVSELVADEWNGTRNLQMKIIDINKSIC